MRGKEAIHETLADNLLMKFLADEPALSSEAAVASAIKKCGITGIRMVEDADEIQSLLLFGDSFDAEGTNFRNINDAGRRTEVMQYIVNEFWESSKVVVKSCYVAAKAESGDELELFFETDWNGKEYSLEMDWFLFEQQRFACRAMAKKYFADVVCFSRSY